MAAYDTLRERIAAAPRRTRWFWVGALVFVMLLVLGAALLRRRGLLRRLEELRGALAERKAALLDAKTAAQTARHVDAIERHEARVRELEEEIKGLEVQVVDAEAAHASALRDIDQAQDWEALERLRKAGNTR